MPSFSTIDGEGYNPLAPIFFLFRSKNIWLFVPNAKDRMVAVFNSVVLISCICYFTVLMFYAPEQFRESDAIVLRLCYVAIFLSLVLFMVFPRRSVRCKISETQSCSPNGTYIFFLEWFAYWTLIFALSVTESFMRSSDITFSASLISLGMMFTTAIGLSYRMLVDQDNRR